MSNKKPLTISVSNLITALIFFAFFVVTMAAFGMMSVVTACSIYHIDEVIRVNYHGGKWPTYLFGVSAFSCAVMAARWAAASSRAVRQSVKPKAESDVN